MNRRIALALLLGSMACSHLDRAVAGPYADDMAKCLVSASTPADRSVLVQWIFSVATLHPDLASLSSVSPQQRDALAKSAGGLFERLITDTCRAQVQQAVQNEGTAAIQYAFTVLGQVAMRSLLTDPKVAKGMESIAKNVDEQKIKAALSAEPGPAPSQPPGQAPDPTK